MAKLSVMDQMIYNKFKTRREKNVTLRELANVKWNGNKPKEMSMGSRFRWAWQNSLRQHIYDIRKQIEPDETIRKTAKATYMLTKKDGQKFLEWIARLLRNESSVDRSNKLLQGINPAALPPIENGKRLEDAKKDSYFVCKALESTGFWIQKIRKSRFKNGKISKA